MTDKFSTIPIFISVVETGSFTAAAQRLGMTKSAVSKRISTFEGHLGIKLLNRTTRSISLTEAGLTYYDYLRAANALVLEGEDAINESQQDARGILKITVPMVFGRLHISPILPEFLKQNPNIDLHLTMDDQEVDLVAEGFDMGIRIGELPDSSLVARCLSPCSSVLCATPSYLEKQGYPQVLSDLRTHNCLRYTYYRGGRAWHFHGPDGEERFIPKGRYHVNNSEGLYDALLADLGIAQMPRFIVAPALADGRLIPILNAYRLPGHHIFAVYPQRRFMPEKVRRLLAFFMANFGEGSDYQKNYEGA